MEAEIVTVLNERFGTEFEEADCLFFEQIKQSLLDDETLRTQAKVNELDTFQYAFADKFIEKLMEQNKDIFDKILGDEAFGNLVKGVLMRQVYGELRG